MYVKVNHSGRGLREVEKDCVAVGFVIKRSTYEPGYPIYGEIAVERLQALRAVESVTSVEEVPERT